MSKIPFTLEGELWKTIPSFPEYMVSNMGRVKRLAFNKRIGNNSLQYRPERLLTPRERNGYLVVTLSQNYHSGAHYIHRLVALAFIPNPNNLPEIDHIDTNRKNNNVINLRWCSRKENANNPITKRKQSSMRKGVKRGPMQMETKKKIGLAHKGRHHSVSHMQHYLESCRWRYKPIRVYKDEKIIGDFEGLNTASKVLGISRTALANSIKTGKPNRYGYLIEQLENTFKRDENKF